MQTVTRPTQNNHPPPQNEKKPEQERNRPPQYQPTDHERRRRKGKKKKQVREQCLGPRGICGARGPDRRRSPRPASREHKGKPKPQTGFGFPQRLREREKKKNVVGEHTKQRKTERGDTNIKANKGQVLKGTNPNMIPTPETKKAIQTNRTNNPKTLNKKPITKQTKSRRNYHNRVAGPMGRPALSEETPQGTVVPRGPRTPPPREPPPVAQELASCRTINSYPRKLGPTLSRSEEA